jgi:hypothetical protein
MADVAVVTNTGLSMIVDALIALNASTPKYIGWGTGTTPAAVANTGLETAAAEARTTGTASVVTTNTTDDTFQVVGSIQCASAGKAITEVALFDDATVGSDQCFFRGTFDVINVSVGDSIQFTIKAVLDQGA